jgi:hypothetical protein
MPLAACITAVLLNCHGMPAHKADRLPRSPRGEPVHQVAAPPDVERQLDDPRSSPAASEPIFGLSPDEVVAIGFQEVAIYLPPEPEPEKSSRRERRKKEKAERRAKRRNKPVDAETVTTKVKKPVLAYAVPEPAGRRSLFAGIFSIESNDDPGFAPSAAGGYTAVKYEAKIQDVPEKLALSIARIESNGACAAQSSANAIGVMQIKHATAQMIGYKGTAKGLKNCKISAKWGVKYLALCLDLADGDVKKAALCYNQGHGTLTNKRKYGNRVNRTEAKGYIAKMKAQGWRL